MKYVRRSQPDAAPLSLKVRPDTLAIGICRDCRSCQVMQGPSQQHVLAHCLEFACDLTFPVERCSQFFPKHEPMPLWAMAEVAWILDKDKQSKIGFQHPDEWRRRNPERGVLDET